MSGSKTRSTAIGSGGTKSLTSIPRSQASSAGMSNRDHLKMFAMSLSASIKLLVPITESEELQLTLRQKVLLALAQSSSLDSLWHPL